MFSYKVSKELREMPIVHHNIEKNGRLVEREIQFIKFNYQTESVYHRKSNRQDQ